ncbi:sterol desaturase family protein [Tropicimonas marinistellae]|uniref:sterol desaturase family protein n=1 Tax=Tropicimonas marinistellae TaxID=1739787 RepID=UPI00082ADA53|nr:sterol desaturase family protein [Tropicimonas marinistellae]
MDDLEYGTRDKRGNWAPNTTLEVAPFWTGNWNKMGQFLKEFIWPWNALHMATALLYWVFVLPDIETMKTISWSWALYLLAVNAVGIFLLYGAIEFFYYVKRKQRTRFKYNAKFPSENPSDVFWFKSQNLDNFLRSFFIGIPIWTAVEVVMLWCFANGIHVFGWVNWQENWLWLTLLTLLVPAIHEIHFFGIHRLIHTPALYKWIHSVHHNSINPSPWSSLSMHPVEHALYFGEVVWHLIIPSNPIVMMFNSHVLGYGALNGHIGFDKLELTEETPLDSHAYAHYLHHKYFEVNYGADGLVPLDKWFGYWHDGSQEADEKMKARFRKKKERVKANQASAKPAK